MPSASQLSVCSGCLHLPRHRHPAEVSCKSQASLCSLSSQTQAVSLRPGPALLATTNCTAPPLQPCASTLACCAPAGPWLICQAFALMWQCSDEPWHSQVLLTLFSSSAFHPQAGPTSPPGYSVVLLQSPASRLVQASKDEAALVLQVPLPCLPGTCSLAKSCF